MTEAEWMAVTEPLQMLGLLGDNPNLRKLRLFACACCREVWNDQWPDAHRKLVPIIEQYVDGTVDIRELTATRSRALRPTTLDLFAKCLKPDADPGISNGLYICLAGAVEDNKLASSLRFESSIIAMEKDPEFKAAVRLCFRDIFPFRTVGFVPAWRTDTVLALAREMYESRDFSAMPILADALQDAGCGNERVLNHCRGEGPHARGCWLVDAILGKE